MQQSSWLPLECLNMVYYPYFRNQFWFSFFSSLSVVKMCIYPLFFIQYYHCSETKSLFLDFTSLYCIAGKVCYLRVQWVENTRLIFIETDSDCKQCHPSQLSVYDFMQSVTWTHLWALEYLTGNTKEEEKKSSNEFQVAPLKEIQIL